LRRIRTNDPSVQAVHDIHALNRAATGAGIISDIIIIIIIIIILKAKGKVIAVLFN
jgi:hypothetical protein